MKIPLQFRLMSAAALIGKNLVPLYDDEPASGMSASGQDPQGLEAKPASPTAESGDANKASPNNSREGNNG